jgi:hypothetical protein
MANKSINIKFIKAHDYKTSFITGIYGGMAPNGLINVNFFTDRAILPKSQTIEVDEKGVAIGLPINNTDADFAREIQFGTIMDVNTARMLVDFLQSKIAEFKK